MKDSKAPIGPAASDAQAALSCFTEFIAMHPDPHRPTPLLFTQEELDMLGRTADALSAYMGKPVLAEVVDADETGYEWAIFGVPLDVSDDAGEMVTVQIGGPGARIMGNKGGLQLEDGDVYECQYLWAIQLCDLEGVRYIKVDEEGEEVAWSDDLGNVLPFALNEPPAPRDDDEDEQDNAPDTPPTLH